MSLSNLREKYKLNIGATLLALFYWLVTFYTDTKLFTSAPLNMNCLPVDTAMVLPMHILTKMVLLVFLIFLFAFLGNRLKKPKQLLPFVGLMLIYGVGLLATYPGYYMSDDPIIFAYATRYYPVYWHNYLTSLFYMVGMSLFPASCGPVLLSDILYAVVYTYFYERGSKLLVAKGASAWQRFLLLVAGVLPFTLLGALMCFRPAIYSIAFLFYFIYLYFEKKECSPLTLWKLLGLAFLTAVLAFWRSESIVLLPIGFILIGLTYFSGSFFSKNALKKCAIFLVLSICFLALIKLPQSHGEAKYYGKDYLIISTTRPLSLIVHRDQTYEGAQEDLENIDAITNLGYLHNDVLSCSAYNRYNCDNNQGLYTQTGASAEAQSAYIKSALRLIAHNLDLYFGERLQLFFITNGYFDYNPDLVLGQKQVVSTGFVLYEHDRDYGFEMLRDLRRVPIEHQETYALALFKFGGEAYIPMLILTFVLLIGSLIRKDWFVFFSMGALIAREAVIFLTAPASFIQYSYPLMYVTGAFALLLLTQFLSKKKEA